MRLFFLAFVFLCSACAPQRPPLPPGVVPEQRVVSADEERYGQEVLAGLLDQFSLSQDDADINRARDIVDRLSQAAGGSGDPWHVYVLVDPHFKNAAATRGNYIFVWTGMLGAIQSDGELAAVLSHEMGHVLAGHTDPNPSDQVAQILAQVIGMATGQIVGSSSGAGQILSDIASQAAQKTVEAVAVNPRSQRYELEADQVGLFLMTRAGYDPNEAVTFWDRAQSDPDLSGGGIPFLSTHPSSAERLAKLKEVLPLAQEQSTQSNTKNVRPSPHEPTTAVAENRTFRVWRSFCPILSKPDYLASTVTEVPQGTSLQGLPVDTEWIKITEPFQGFALKSNLTEISPSSSR